MNIRVVKPGLQTTIQASPRIGLRHFGVPASGAADPLSLALANRLVGNALLAPALEATLVGPALEFEVAVAFAITGADVMATLNGSLVDMHKTLFANPGDMLAIGSADKGARAYVAFAGGLRCHELLGSASTYLTAGIGGYEGRALVKGDTIEVVTSKELAEELTTPVECRVAMQSAWTLRACAAPETALLNGPSRMHLFESAWTVDTRADRMGIRLEAAPLIVESDGRMPSAAVFPGTVQCTEGGAPFALGVDAGTTGGYPRVAQVARVDRHILGQLRPGDRVRFLARQPLQSRAELRGKHDYFRRWLPGIETVV